MVENSHSNTVIQHLTDAFTDSVNVKNMLAASLLLMSTSMETLPDLSIICKNITTVSTSIGAVLLLAYNGVKFYKELKNTNNDNSKK